VDVKLAVSGHSLYLSIMNESGVDVVKLSTVSGCFWEKGLFIFLSLYEWLDYQQIGLYASVYVYVFFT